jgi:lipoprotein NlpD
LYSIARRFGVDYRDLARWNGIGSDYQIFQGQVLHLRGANARKSAATPPSAPAPKAPAPPPVAAFKWLWPTLSQSYVSTTRPNGGLGLMINGQAQQVVRAAGPGRVVYSGAGLLGYGQLLIVKHDDTYLSAYGYTENILVKEGDAVSAGQKIASMGKGPSGVSQLYFEIRVNGKPIDPLSLLPRQL